MTIFFDGWGALQWTLAYAAIALGVALPLVMSQFENKWSGSELLVGILLWPLWLGVLGVLAVVLGTLRLIRRGVRHLVEACE